MERLVVYTLLACLVVSALSVHTHSASLTGETKRMFQQHIRRVRGFKCSLPRPRSVAVSELEPVSSWVYLPPVTVLHRCDAGAGCCLTPGYSCQVVDSQIVNLTFHVTDVMGTLGHTQLVLPAVNHTKCDCLEDNPSSRQLSSNANTLTGRSVALLLSSITVSVLSFARPLQ